MSDLPNIDYWSAPKKRRRSKIHQVFGLFIFLVYCILALFFDVMPIGTGFFAVEHGYPKIVLLCLSIPITIGVYCTWRSVDTFIRYFG
jgi:hypothetical protein